MTAFSIFWQIAWQNSLFLCSHLLKYVIRLHWRLLKFTVYLRDPLTKYVIFFKYLEEFRNLTPRPSANIHDYFPKVIWRISCCFFLQYRWTNNFSIFFFRDKLTKFGTLFSWSIHMIRHIFTWQTDAILGFSLSVVWRNSFISTIIWENSWYIFASDWQISLFISAIFSLS